MQSAVARMRKMPPATQSILHALARDSFGTNNFNKLVWQAKTAQNMILVAPPHEGH